MLTGTLRSPWKIALVALFVLCLPANAEEIDRRDRYVGATVADATTLNPVLNADTVSSRICDLVFDGLIDRDKDLNWRGRLAERWEISELAYALVNPASKWTAEQLVEAIRKEQARRKDENTLLGRCLRNIAKVAVEPAGVSVKTPRGAPNQTPVRITVHRPPRLKLVLSKVDPDVFERLAVLLGREPFKPFNRARLLWPTPDRFPERRAEQVRTYLPMTQHKPVILFHLRRGVLFHDGHQFDAGDVRFTYQAAINRKNLSPRISDFEPIESVEAVDAHTVRVTCKRLCAPGLGVWAMGILPEHLLNEKALRAEAKHRGIPFERFSLRQSEFNRRPVGCGAWRFVEWKPKTRLRLRRFNQYWDGAPELKEYVVHVIPERWKQKAALVTGALDRYSPTAEELGRFEDLKRFQRFSSLSFGYTYIGYNMRRRPFKDRRVRRALGMALDVGAMIREAAHSQAVQATGPYPVQTAFNDPAVKPLPCDPKAAAKLLEQAGWTRGRTGWTDKDGRLLAFTLITNTGNDARAEVMKMAAAAWGKLGIPVKTEKVEWARLIQHHVDARDFDAIILGWSMGLDGDLYQLFHSGQAGKMGLNFCGFSHPKADDLIERIRYEYEPAAQAKVCRELHRLIAEEQPYTFLFVSRWTALLDGRLRVVRRDRRGRIVGYDPIRQTRLGNYGFDFNRWGRPPEPPR